MYFRLLSAINRKSVVIANYYESKQIGLGIEFIDKFEEACVKIESNYRGYPRLESIETERDIRRVLLDRFPYLIVYEILPDEVLGLALRHVSQEPGKDSPVAVLLRERERVVRILNSAPRLHALRGNEWGDAV